MEVPPSDRERPRRGALGCSCSRSPASPATVPPSVATTLQPPVAFDTPLPSRKPVPTKRQAGGGAPRTHPPVLRLSKNRAGGDVPSAVPLPIYTDEPSVSYFLSRKRLSPRFRGGSPADRRGSPRGLRR